jgi:uncharacterized membrane protein YhiD involved in acid resistance
MGVQLVERHGLEFQPRTDLAARRRERSTGSDWTRRVRVIFGGRSLTVGAAALTVVTLFVIDRRFTLSMNAPPTVRLGVAAAMGIILTAVHQHARGGRLLGYSLARAQTLLCVAGALTMILIDNSIARAFGIAGAASIVRFRTPVEDPTDATVLFVAMALGMASGVGAFGLSIAGTAGVCVLLIAFGTFAPESRRRNITIELVASGHDFPAQHVQDVFSRHNIDPEPAEWSQDADTRVRYRASVDEALSLEALGAHLMNKGQGGLQSVTWEVRKSAN